MSPLNETLLRPGDSADLSKTRPWSSLPSGRLPPDLLAESVRRLRTVALLYSFTFFMANLFPSIVCPTCFPEYFAEPLSWAPSVVSIAMGLAVFAVTRSTRVSAEAKMQIGLGFEVLGSAGIAVAELGTFTGGAVTGQSWVSVWMLVFTIVVPTPPRRALVAAALSGSTVPITAAVRIVAANVPIDFTLGQFFFAMIFPFILVVIMAYVAARVVYRLGTEVSRARELGSYRLIERLGTGGMGEVWRAEHRLLARPAAVKLIRPNALGSESPEQHRVLLRRFEREAQATATMRCHHTVELYDFGVADDGTFYYVMELLDGFDLDTLVTRFGPVPTPRVVHFLLQVCHSLGEAHENGLIHRDIKPANVYACRLGREVDCIKVLDFGMVKTRTLDQTGEVKLTADDKIGGTPAFMAPEQVLADGRVDGRTDIYAAGCLTYWLLTGRLVFEGKTAMDTMVQHVQAVPAPPSRRTELPIPPALDAVVMACLEKDPAGRPQTADDLAARLKAAAGDERWSPEQARKWWDAHRPRQSRSGRPLTAAPAALRPS